MKMVAKYLFFIILANTPFVIGLYINGTPTGLHQDYTVKPTVYNDQYGNQQAMVCIPVPVIIQGMNPENTGRPEHRVPTSRADASAPRAKSNLAVDIWARSSRSKFRSSAEGVATSRGFTTSTQLPSTSENSDQ